MNDMTGKVALVTGGSRGIGAAVVLRLARDGADVVLTYAHDHHAAGDIVEKVKAAGRRALAVRVDSADTQALRGVVEQTVAEFGRLDILVNNAAVFHVGPIDEVSHADLERTLAVNVRAPFVAAQAASVHMGEGGRIISIGSNVAERTVFGGFSLYAMSKTALTGMTKGLARELGPRGITINVVNPGPTDTALNPADGPNADVINGFTALGHYATPDDIAATVAHLAGEGGRYITGALINVDGGFTV